VKTTAPKRKAVVKKVAAKPAPKRAAAPATKPAAKKKKKVIAKPVVIFPAPKKPKTVWDLRVKKAKPPKPVPTGPAKPKPARRQGLVIYTKDLKHALSVKKPPGPVVAQVLRPDYGEGLQGNKDAERLLGVSRQVH